MSFLTVGIPLFHRIGYILRLIGSWDVSQQDDFLKRVTAGWYIQWFTVGMITNSDLIPTPYGHDNSDWIYIHLVGPDRGVIPDILEKEELFKLVLGFGTDLKVLWKLRLSDIVDIFERLVEVGYIESFNLRITKNNSSGEFNTDPTQPSPFPSCPPMTDPTPSSPENYPTGTGAIFDQFIDNNAGIELSMEPWMPSDPVPNTKFHANPATPTTFVNGDVVSTPAEELFTPSGLTPGPDTGALSYPTPSSQFNSPPAGRPLTLPVSGSCLSPSCSANTLQSIGTPPDLVATPVSVPSPGADASPYPTSYSANSPRGSARGSQQQQIISRLLQSCKFGDKNVLFTDIQIGHICKAEARILPRDPLGILQPIFDAEGTIPSSLSKLGLPESWEGKDGAVNYLKVLEEDKSKKKPFSCPLARRVAQILLFVSYKSLCMQQGETGVVTSILTAYNNDPSKSKSSKCNNNRFSTYYIRRGRWWWRFAASLGFGILLVADEKLVDSIHDDRFSNDQINALITFILHTRPGTVRLLHSLGAVAISILNGVIDSRIRHIILDNNTGLLRQAALTTAADEDQRAFQNRPLTNPLVLEDTTIPANEELTAFLAIYNA
ncbi:hypothetical protein EYZ11_010565 [Aspergillus tanneri]|uniref:Uncharacterized protein n=1 Tax=Aspergillus tanneri TaxID=1220188 RepID=A0A4S3J505_9EURO|nr:hypothetical protein EYZ11_010565 [Aspergillus tanneri]